MLFLIAFGGSRPNILQTEEKGEKYHGEWARYCLSQANNQLHTEFVNKIQLNKAFYKNRQWILDEDIESFLLDSTNQSRNRLALKNNVIQPIVEQYRGNAIRMNINAKVKAVSPMAVNRRQSKLNEMFFLSNVANQPGNPFGEQMKKRYPIGDNELETERIFDNTWSDTFVRNMNHLVTYIENLNRMSAMQPRVAEEICFSGIGVVKSYEYGGNQLFDVLESQNFFWDRSNKLYDLTDCEFMGDVNYMASSEVFEKCDDLEPHIMEAIELFCRQYSKTGASVSSSNAVSSQLNKYKLGGRVPVYNTYWRDGEEFEYGYVMDQFGYPYFTRINYVYEGEENPRYTDIDLIEVDTIRSKQLLKGKKKTKIFRETIRYCSFIPREILASTSETNSGEDKYYDVILEHGVVPYQETDNVDYIRAKFPFKSYCWAYVDGETMSPIDVCIDPQRFINRVLSVAENQINNSGGVNIVYDKSMVDAQDGEENMMRNIHQSKPVGMNAKGRGMQNALMPYDATVKQGTLGLFGIAETMKKFLQDTTGVNDALQGNNQDEDALVGVTQLMIQRGSLVQEPFYNALREIFLQCYQSMACMGKKIYSDNERELSIAAGDEGVKVFKITKNMGLEDFSAFVKLENSDESLVAAANAQLVQLRDAGLIDEYRLAELWGRSTPDDVGSAMRAYAKEKREMARAQNKEQAQKETQMAEFMDQQVAEQKHEAYEQQAREDVTNLTNQKHQTDLTYAKALAKVAQTSKEAESMIINKNKQLQNQVVV